MNMKDKEKWVAIKIGFWCRNWEKRVLQNEGMRN